MQKPKVIERFVRLQLSGKRAVTVSPTGATSEEFREKILCCGFTDLQCYIEGLLKTTKRFEALTLFTQDGERGFALWSRAGKIETFFTIHQPDDAGYEKKIRNLFSSLGGHPHRDFVAENGVIPTMTRYLLYCLSGTAAEITALTIRLLRDIYMVPENGLFEIERREDKAH